MARKVLKLQVSDRLLVTRALKGDAGAFREIYERHSPKVRGIAVRMGFPRQWDKDMEQNAWLRIWKNLHKWDNKAALSSWMYRVAMNEALMKLRAEKIRRVQYLEDVDKTGRYKWKRECWATYDKSSASEPFEVADSKPLQDRVLYAVQILHSYEKALRRISKEAASVVIATDLLGLDGKAVAALSNSTLPAVKSRLNRGRIQIKKRLLAASIKDVVNF